MLSLRAMGLLDNMIWIDFAIIGLVFIYMIMGLIRGGSKETLSLLSWILSIGVSWGFALEFSDFLAKLLADQPTKIAASFASLLVITRLFTSFVFFLMKDDKTKTKISIADHIFGFLVGSIRGAVIVAAIILIGGFTSLPKDAWWSESKLIPPFQSSAIWIRDNIPSGVSGFIRFS